MFPRSIFYRLVPFVVSHTAVGIEPRALFGYAETTVLPHVKLYLEQKSEMATFINERWIKLCILLPKAYDICRIFIKTFLLLPFSGELN